MSNLEDVYQKLLKIREREDLTFPSPTFLKENFTNFDGSENPLTLRYYQMQGVYHLISMKRFILGDDTGLGKTLQAIGSMCFLWDRDPTLKAVVLTTKSAVGQWELEFQKFTEGIHTIVCKGTPKKRAKIRQEFLDYDQGPCVLISGYRTVVQDFSEMMDWDIGLLVLDECTAIKNPKALVSQRIGYLAREQSQYVWGLSATIIKNNLMEGWGIFRSVCPGLFGSKSAFMGQYCITRLQRIPGSRRQIPVIVGYRRGAIDEFRKKIDPFFLGRSKLDVAPELPSLIQKNVLIEMNKRQQSKYAEALAGLLDMEDGTEKETTQLTSIIYCQQIVNDLRLLEIDYDKSPKLDTLLDMVTEGEFADEKVIIFSRFRKFIDIVVPALEKKGLPTVRITGAENVDQRKESMQKFQDPKSGINHVCITMAASEAINLQAAKAIIFLDSPWSAGDFLQILGRMIRIGSIHERVFAVHLMAKDSIDYRVMKVLKDKLKLVQSVIGKRIKGEEDSDMIIEEKNDITAIFRALQEDAQKFQ